jgi:hypothetical protein
MIAINFLLLIALKLHLLHPFHVSVCDMVYESDDKHLKISVRLFLDDLEDALDPASGLEPYDISLDEHWELTQRLLKDYFSETLQLKVKNKSITPIYLGSEIEGDAMWCYLEVQKLRPFNEITVLYTTLKEVFDDQENLVHVRVDGIVKSCRMFGDKNQETLIWD